MATSVALAGAAAAGTDAAAGRDAAVALPWSGLSVGVNDDSGKSTLRDWVYPVMSDDGLRLNTLTLTWDETEPLKIAGRAEVAAAIAAARANGIETELDLYPLHSQAFTHGNRCKPSADPLACGDSARIAQFAAWTAQVADEFPSVHQFVVMNECNQPRFVNPQWNAAGKNQSAAICGRALAAAYDALKDADRSNFIWGVGLSPRGNDAPRAASNSSTSPVKFLANLGAWFKSYATKTQRAAPLMDGFDFHPYPVPQSLPFATGYANPNDASIANLPRIYQAFYDAFAGSAQRTIGQQRGGGLPVSLNETGVQTASSGPAYHGWQTSATAAGGVLGQWATEAYQARWYVAMLDVVACDPNVRLVNIFHLLDEADLSGWQSGLYFADQTPKLSAAAVRGWIASTGARCNGAQLPWKPGRAFSLPAIDLSKLKLPTSTPVALPPAIPLVAPAIPQLVAPAASLLADTTATATVGTTAPVEPTPAEAPPQPEDSPPPEG